MTLASRAKEAIMAHSVFLQLVQVTRYQRIGMAISTLQGNGVGLLQGYKVVHDFIKELDAEDPFDCILSEG